MQLTVLWPANWAWGSSTLLFLCLEELCLCTSVSAPTTCTLLYQGVAFYALASHSKDDRKYKVPVTIEIKMIKSIFAEIHLQSL